MNLRLDRSIKAVKIVTNELSDRPKTLPTLVGEEINFCAVQNCLSSFFLQNLNLPLFAGFSHQKPL